MRIGIFDLETNGLLDEVTKIHLGLIRIIEDGVSSPVYAYRWHEGDGPDFLALLETCDMLVGQNIIDYDLDVLEKLENWYVPEHIIIRDTLPMLRMMYANIKERDFRLQEKGLMEGKYIGQHTLAAWGQRLGKPKDDYSDRMKEKGLDPWAEWNPEMEAYGIQDVETNTEMFFMCEKLNWDPSSVRLEHRIHHLMHLQERFGFNFDIEKAKELSEVVHEDFDRLNAETIQYFGKWVSPKKLSKVPPRAEFGEDHSRKHWAEVTVPGKTIAYKIPNTRMYVDDAGELQFDGAYKYAPTRTVGEPFCEVKIMEFNPNSRPQIIDRLTKIWQWEPVDFTEKGNPKLDDDVLRNLAEHIPIADDLAELFFLNKLLGQLENGKNAWLALVKDDGRIHPYTNVGGTVSGRASHLSPNIAQVPKVVVVDVKLKTGEWNPKVLGKDGKPIPDVFDEQGIPKKKIILKGRAGKYGWECRNLFKCPEGWTLVGCDLSGIELRCLAARLAKYDGGEYVREVLEGDPHTKNQIAFQLDSRDKSKTTLYAIMYGGGDLKIGSIVLPPSATAGEMKNRGKQLKANLQKGIPAFGKLLKEIGAQARGKGYLIGLDGRKLYCRSPHSALNLQLQSDGALIAKVWCLFAYDMMEEAGYVFGVDYGFCAWVHDEIQMACRTPEIAEFAKTALVQAAKEAGEYFDYASPVGAEAKIGKTWAETH